jgi:predicted nuclease of predicted toxin-antitoxin system
LRLICDANVGSIIAQALAGRGHDVERAIYVTPSADDETVLAYAVANARVLVTCDSDFGDLVFFRGHAPPPAIIYIRFEPDDVGDIVPRLLAIPDFDRLRGHITVLGDEHVRRRPFTRKADSDG